MPELAGGPDEGLDVLGEAGAAVTGAGKEKRAADAPVGADAAPDVRARRPRPARRVGDLVHERDPGGEHRVGGVLGDLGRGMSMKRIGLPVRTNGA